MKEKLEVIREALTIVTRNNVDRFGRAAGDGLVTLEARDIVDTLIAELDSLELIDKVCYAIKDTAALGEDLYSNILGNTNEVAKAVINAIKINNNNKFI